MPSIQKFPIDFALLVLPLALTAAQGIFAQQLGDPDFSPAVGQAAFPEGKGPVVLIDEAHHNFHTADGRYQPFAELLRRDGYVVKALRSPLTTEEMEGADVLVISNALAESNVEDWALPTPSAFSDKTPHMGAAGMLQGAALRFGSGRVAVFGEAAMFTAQLAGPQRRPMGMNHQEAPHNAQFALNVLHWLSGLLPPE